VQSGTLGARASAASGASGWVRLESKEAELLRNGTAETGVFVLSAPGVLGPLAAPHQVSVADVCELLLSPNRVWF
jgi:hypothetical protein